MKPETLGSLLAAARKNFAEAGIETAPLDARLLLLAATGFSKAENTALAMAQSAASQMASAVRPGAGPMAMLNQAADTTDRIGALIAAATRGDSGN